MKKTAFALFCACMSLTAPAEAAEPAIVPTGAFGMDFIEKTAPDKAGALAIAQKFYNMCHPNIDPFLATDFMFIVDWTPDFTGRRSDPKRASDHSTVAVLTQRQTAEAYFYTALNAAVFDLDPEGTAGALNLAAAIATCGEDLEAKGMKIDRREFNADALRMYYYALRTAGANGNHAITALTGAAGVLYEMGELDAAQMLLERVVGLDAECAEAFDMLFNLYIETSQKHKAQELFKKSPTRPMALSAKKAMEDERTDFRDKMDSVPESPATEAELAAVAGAFDGLRNSSIADYYEEAANQAGERAKIEAIRRHVEQMKERMTGINPPDMEYVMQYSTHDAYWNSGVSFRSTLGPWGDQLNKLIAQRATLDDKYMEKLNNLAILAASRENYFNPNDISFQSMLVKKINDMIITFFGRNLSFVLNTTMDLRDIQRIREKKAERLVEKYQPQLDKLSLGPEVGAYEDLHLQWDREIRNDILSWFANSTKLAGPRYLATRDAVIKSYPTVMVHIMMVSDPDVQNYLLTWWDEVMTTITIMSMSNLAGAYGVMGTWWWYPPDETEFEMVDPRSTEEWALSQDERSNAEIQRQQQAMRDFYEMNIDENSSWYKRENENYGNKMDFILFKFEMNDFIVKTSTRLDLGAFKGQLKTVTNNLRGSTAYDGSIKVGLYKGDKGGVGATGSFSFTTDGSGNITPSSIQWSGGLEAKIGGGGFEVSGGAGGGSEGAYAEIKGEFSKLGGKVEVGVETTTLKGTKISSGVSISNEAVKEMSVAEILSKAAKDNKTPEVGQFGNWYKKEKVLWTGEYVVHEW